MKFTIRRHEFNKDSLSCFVGYASGRAEGLGIRGELLELHEMLGGALCYLLEHLLRGGIRFRD